MTVPQDADQAPPEKCQSRFTLPLEGELGLELLKGPSVRPLQLSVSSPV